MAALAIASSFLARLLTGAPVKPSPSADADPAHPLLPLDGLFTKLLGQIVEEEVKLQAGTPASSEPTIVPSSIAAGAVQLAGATGLRWAGLAVTVPSGNYPASLSAVAPSIAPHAPLAKAELDGELPKAEPAVGKIAMGKIAVGKIAARAVTRPPTEPAGGEVPGQASASPTLPAPPAQLESIAEPVPNGLVVAEPVRKEATGGKPAASGLLVSEAISKKTGGDQPIPNELLVAEPVRKEATGGKPAASGLPVSEPISKKTGGDEPIQNELPAAVAPVTVPAAALPRESAPKQTSPLPPEHEARAPELGLAPAKTMNWPPPLPESVNSEPGRMAAAVELPKPVDTPEVRVVAAGVPEMAEIAFTAQLAPLIAPEQPAIETEHRVERTRLESTPAVPPASDNPPLTDTLPRTHGDATGFPSQEPVRAVAARPRRQDGWPQAPPDQPVAAPGRTAVHPQSTVQPHPEIAPATERATEQPDPAARTQAEPPPEPPKAAGPAREIRLALGGTEQRVEVKLTDRGGEVQVAVRTADGHLAERLRDNLPALTSRLAESGIRAETWHPQAGSGSDWRRTTETATASSGDPSDPQPQQQDREPDREGQPRRPHVLEETEQPKEKGKDFTWLMSTLR